MRIIDKLNLKIEDKNPAGRRLFDILTRPSALNTVWWDSIATHDFSCRIQNNDAIPQNTQNSVNLHSTKQHELVGLAMMK